MKKNEEIQEDAMNISSKEKEILDSYGIDANEIDNIEANEELPKESKTKKEKKKKETKPKKSKKEPIEEEIEEYEVDGEAPSENSLENIPEKKEKTKAKKEKKPKKTKQKKNKEIDEYEISNSELEEYEIEEYDEIKSNYEEENDFIEEKEIPEKKQKKKKNKINIIINVIFGIIMILIILAVIDIVMVVKYEKGPIFSIPLKTYDDGGSKEYYGLGYKVIKYNQVQGRRDIEIGSWSLKYNTEPIYLDTIDLAIEANENEEATYSKYYKKFLRITGILHKNDISENKITVSYIDEGKKYNFDVICNMETEQAKLAQLEENSEVTVIGTMIDYKFKSKDNNSTIILDNCFAEQ